MNLKLTRLFFAALVAASVFTLACGGDSKHVGQPSKYPAGSITSEDIANRLKYDARVETFEDSDPKKLVVHVHQSWVASPPGLKERSLHEWYSMWHALRSDTKGIEVEVQHEGVPVAKYTAARGYEIVEQKRSDDSGSSS